MTEVQNSERLLWLDWMKVLAILSIIWGHFFSEGHLYLYVFSVQTFCLISGFLYKKSPNWKICLQKCFWQLLVPTIIMSVIMQLEAYCRCMVLGMRYDISWPWFFKWLLLGHRWCMGPCWYFYTLMVMRVVMQAIPDKIWAYFSLFIILSIGSVSLCNIGFEVSNANVNVLVCMPFFLVGVFIKPLKATFSLKHSYLLEIGLLLFSVFLIIVCGKYNGYVWMYKCGYGENFALYLLGGIAGSIVLYFVSLWLSFLPYRNTIILLSKGSILIIGLHIIIVRRLTELPDRMWGEDLLFSILIIFCFVPIIKLAELFFPVILGRYK